MLFFGRQYPLNFAFRFVINASLDRAKAEKVLHSLARRHTALYAHQEYSRDKQMDMVYDGVPTLLLDERHGDAAWQEILLSCMTREFNPFTGPLFSLDYRNTVTECELFFVFQHGAVDGIAAVYFISDFLKLYQDMPVDLPEHVIMPVLYEVLEEDLYNELLTRPEPDWKKKDPPAPEVFEMPAYKVSDYFLRTFEMDAFATERLVSEAKIAGETVNSYLGALILKASADIFGPSEGMTRTIQCPVDFRQYLKEEFRTVAGVYNGIVKVAVDCTQPVPEMAETIKKGIQASRDGYKDIEDYFHFRDSFDNVPDPESLMMSFPPDPLDYDFSFSNLGRTVIARDYRGLSVSGFFGPVFTAVNGETVIGLNTTNGELRMTLIFDRDIPKAEAYRKLGERIDGILKSFGA